MARIPVGRPHRARPPRRRRRGSCSPQAGGAERDHRPGAPPGVRRGLRRAGALPARGRRRRSACPRTSTRCLRRAAADAAHQLRRAARRAVGPAELVGLHAAPSTAARPSSASSPTGSRARSSRPAAREMSARTGGAVLLQLLQDLTRAGGRADRVLDAPTSEVWIDPWVAHAARARRGRAARRAGRGAAPRGRRGSPAPRSPGSASRPTTTSPRCRSRSCASWPRRRCAPPSRA